MSTLLSSLFKFVALIPVCSCFLVTFYFIHALLPRLMASNKHNGPDGTEDTISTFLKDYGSYLRMDTCLAYASVLRATFVIDLLLSIAKHDPRHREAMKQMSKSTSMVFYEPVSRKLGISYDLVLCITHLYYDEFETDNDVGNIAASTRNTEREKSRQKTSYY